MDVFEAWPELIEPYTYLAISRGGVYGNVITQQIQANGIFKLRNEQVMVNNQELKQSASTLHIYPTESFATQDMVGNGIRIRGQDYEIIGQTDGMGEHFRLTLQNSDYSEYEYDYGS